MLAPSNIPRFAAQRKNGRFLRIAAVHGVGFERTLSALRRSTGSGTKRLTWTTRSWTLRRIPKTSHGGWLEKRP
jgi:hypothetical protein